MGGLCWKTSAILSALLVPGYVWNNPLILHANVGMRFFSSDLRVVFAVFFVLNLFLWGAESSAAVPFTTLLALLCLWFGISLPLNFIGALMGFGEGVSGHGNTVGHPDSS